MTPLELAALTNSALTSYAQALALTLALEVPMLSALAVRWRWARWRDALLGAVAANLLTHPLAYAVAVSTNTWVGWAGVEIAAVVVEWALLSRWWRPDHTVDLALAVLVSNLASAAAGLLAW